MAGAVAAHIGATGQGEDGSLHQCEQVRRKESWIKNGEYESQFKEQTPPAEKVTAFSQL